MMLAKKTLAIAGVLVALAGAAQAQTLLPPVTVQNDAGNQDTMSAPQDDSDVVLRVDRLENNLRTLNGQIEQLQYENRQLQEAVRKLQETAGAHVAQPGLAQQPGEPGKTPATAPTVAATPPKKGDAFDPAAQPNAPGAPRALGIGPAPGLALPKGPISPDETAAAAPLDLSKTGAPATTGETIIATTTPATPREEFDLALNFLKQGQYADAESRFREYLATHPKDRLIPDATYFLGETFFQRKRQREAAEQFLKVSTDYPNSARAPDAMLRLGLSLQALDAREQACATFQEIGRKYPNASSSVKRSAEREIAKNKC